MLENDTAFFIFAIKEVHRLKRKTISEVDHTLFELIKEEYKLISFKKSMCRFLAHAFFKIVLE